MVTVAVAGYGFIGRIHVASFQKLDGVRVVAVVEANQDRLNELIKGNLEVGQEEATLQGVELYRDLGAVLGRRDIDVVDICLPTHLHLQTVVNALNAGHHVICEKPVALTLEEIDTMIDTAGHSDRLLMIAQCIRFWPEYEYLQSVVQSRELGRLLSLMLRRLSGYPGWTGADNWFADPKRSGSALLDLHVHDVDFVNALLGRPEAVFAQGIVGAAGGVEAVFAQYRYSQDVLVLTEGSWRYPGFEMSYHAAFEGGAIKYSNLASPTLEVQRANSEAPDFPDLPNEDGYLRELRYFVDCVRESRAPKRVDLQSVRQSMEIALAEAKSIATGEVVRLAVAGSAAEPS